MPFLPQFVSSFVYLLIWWITLIVFQIFNQVCIPGINSTWSWHRFLFYSLLNFDSCLIALWLENTLYKFSPTHKQDKDYLNICSMGTWKEFVPCFYWPEHSINVIRSHWLVMWLKSSVSLLIFLSSCSIRVFFYICFIYNIQRVQQKE